MLFNAEYDRTLWLLVASNTGSREKISKLISYIPMNVYEEIQKAIIEASNKGIDNDVIFRKSFSGNDCFDYYVLLKLRVNELVMAVRRWKEDSERLEEDYELSLLAISKDNLDEMELFKRGYIGSYSQEFNKIQFMKRGTSVTTEEWKRDYVLLNIPFGYMVGSSLDNLLEKIRIVNVSRKMPDEINIQDFKTPEDVKKLVKSKKRKSIIVRRLKNDI